jgi:hypothetical protein
VRLATLHLAALHLAAVHLAMLGLPILAQAVDLPSPLGLVARSFVLADASHRAGLLERPDALQRASLLVLARTLPGFRASPAELAGAVGRPGRARPDRA